MSERLTGIGVSAGLVAGPLLRVAPAPRLPEPAAVTDVQAELARASAALAAVAAELRRRADAARRPEAAEILQAQAMMAEDPLLNETIADAIRGGRDAAHAIADAFAEHRRAFQAAGGYLAERVTDLDDIRDRAVAASLGRPMPGIPAPGHPYVLAARDLAPADTADLDPEQVLALVTEAGGPTSHTAILARALGLPAVVSCAGALSVPEGTVVRVDGSSGEVLTDADEALVTATRAAAAARRDRDTRSQGPGRTSDGHEVKLLVNIGSAAQLRGDGAAGAEGVGLFRTELLFLDRSTAPGLDEQARAYAEVFAAMSGRPVVIRTLDAGADKPLPFLDQAGEPNPALGVRGLRVARRRPEVLRTQLEAIDLAAQRTGADVRVMAPMVATAAEAHEFATIARAAGLSNVGVMVEVPAAALRARQLLDQVDFLSIGTNDLSQYVFAADRQCGDLAELLDPWQPALLQLIAACATAGGAAGKPVGVCGEAAADPLLAVVLAGLGVTSLSMSPRALAPVRATLAAHTLADCARLARLALAAEDAEQARATVRSEARPVPD
ncbi:phosphoenolpyruvate-protein phosphotransferase [Micromonospora fulviviridis]|uniref:phosphoenolpyruvate--protein phosphotransferase n=1 Tax=Micromonospora fulviviridis TaxID=47860 RepID=UPI0016650652|nr:phosphoenolpyruvate--protein phosphotransferase [Micromonospora fulviviridis]GGR87606.1 phosphoenolpyruvate-protein phosphotransferase [Micromonospora fulviviridis]